MAFRRGEMWLKMKSGEIVFNYKQLWKIEDAFGEIKGSLKTLKTNLAKEC